MFLTDVLEQLKIRIFDANDVPVDSTVALTEQTFKLGAELMVYVNSTRWPSTKLYVSCRL